jgi:hypothetical protein
MHPDFARQWLPAAFGGGHRLWCGLGADLELLLQLLCQWTASVAWITA